MATLSDLTYQDGAYWERDGSGPYALDSAGNLVLLSPAGLTQTGTSGLSYKDGAYWNDSDGSGPWAIRSA